MKAGKKDLIYNLDGIPPLGTAIPLGFQHILAMFVGNVTPAIIISGVLGLSVDERAFLIQCTMFVSGIVSLIQCYPIGPAGARLPIVMGTSFGFIPVSIAIASKYGLPGLFGAAFLGGIFQVILGFLFKNIRKYFPPLITGIVILSIGLSLIGTGMKYFAGGAGAEDFGSPQNLILGTIVLIIVLFFKQFTKGVTSMSAVLIALILGYIIAIPMGKVNFSAVADASLFAIPLPLKYGMEFHMDAVIPMIVMYVISAVETVGNTCGIASGGLGRSASNREVSGAVIADGIGSAFGAVFNVLPVTSYGQNVGIITMTKVVNRFSVATGLIFLLISGLFPKIGAIVALMPPSVLGGASIVMFSMIIVSGINQVTEEPLKGRNSMILAVSLGLGLGFGMVPDASKHFPDLLKMLFEGSGVAVATIVAIFLNIILPKDEEK